MKTAPRVFFLALPIILGATTLIAQQRPQPADGSRAQCRDVKSAILRQAVRYCAILPPRYDADATKKFPVLYYLHGLGDSEQTLVKSNGWNMVEQLWEEGKIGRFIVVTPNAWDTFYINARDGRQAYEDFLIREFIPEIEKRYRAAGTKAGRGVAGFSMGGYGALRLGFKYPQMFAAASAHSAVLDEDRDTDIISTARGLRAFGVPFDGKYWKANSPFTLARASASKLTGLKVYFDCGREDDFGLAAGAQAFHDLLQQLKVPHEFHIYPGNHSWEYVEEHLAASLGFQSRALNAPK